MKKDEVIKRINKIKHTDVAWIRILEQVETDAIDKVQANRYLRGHQARVASGDKRSKPFVKLWQGIVDLANKQDGCVPPPPKGSTAASKQADTTMHDLVVERGKLAPGSKKWRELDNEIAKKSGRTIETLSGHKRNDDGYFPVVYSGKSMPDKFFGNRANKMLNSDGFIIKLPPRAGMHFQIIGQRPGIVPSQPCWGVKFFEGEVYKTISPRAFNRVIPSQSCHALGYTFGQTYRCRFRWRDDRRDWVVVATPEAQFDPIGLNIHGTRDNWTRGNAGGPFGGVPLPDPINYGD